LRRGHRSLILVHAGDGVRDQRRTFLLDGVTCPGDDDVPGSRDRNSELTVVSSEYAAALGWKPGGRVEDH
jgi:hypothetical protein